MSMRDWRPTAAGFLRWWLAALTLALLAGCATSPLLYSPQRVRHLASQHRIWDAALAMKGIDTGPRGQPFALAIVFDPNCPACKQQFDALQPLLDRVRIHWIPIGFDHSTLSMEPQCPKVAPSLMLGATLLSRWAAASALRSNERDYDTHTCRGGYAASAHVPAWARSAIRSNAQAMSQLKAYGVPALIYPTASGGAMHLGVLEGVVLRRLIHGKAPVLEQ